MKIDLLNNQNQVPVQAKPILRFSQWLMEQVNLLRPEYSWTELSLVIMNDKGIRKLNLEQFGKDHPTDVISFNYDALPCEDGTHSGEIIVNAERAEEEGRQRSGGVARELAWYIAHGCHHLTGADDATEPQRAAMHRQEQAWLDEAASLGLLEGMVGER